MYLLHTMCAIVSDIIMYRWLNFICQVPCMHQKDRPANKQLSPKDAMQAPSYYVFDKEQSYPSYHDTTCHNLLAKALCKSACLCLLEHSSTTAQKLSPLALLCTRKNQRYHMVSNIPACIASAPSWASNNITCHQRSCNTAFVTQHHALCMFKGYIWFE